MLPVRLGDEYAAEGIIVDLRHRGVEVEIRNESWAAADKISASIGVENQVEIADFSQDLSTLSASSKASQQEQERDPIQLFSVFLGSPLGSKSLNIAATTDAEALTSTKPEKTKTNGLQQQLRDDLHLEVLREGKDTLERLLSSSATAASPSSFAIGRAYNLRMEQVSLTNFGPFGGGPLVYPLAKRGLVLLRGQGSSRGEGGEDGLAGQGADSNGAGKTSLAMSVMWALTGSMDPRLG